LLFINISPQIVLIY
jgi:hypothetical protein